jgi:uncharacterized protein (DUF3084 family)
MIQLLFLPISMVVMKISLLLFLLRPKETASIVKITRSVHRLLVMDVLTLALVLTTTEKEIMSEVGITQYMYMV